jgi:predicted DNA-binding transcriptional regulator AlpA
MAKNRPVAPDNFDAFTIEEFCRRHMISRPTYNRLRVSGRGPREIKLDQKVLITREAAADWRQEREAETLVDRSTRQLNKPQIDPGVKSIQKKSIQQFCHDWGISRTTFYLWQAQGKAPALVQPLAGGRAFITEKAELEWARLHTHQRNGATEAGTA